MNLSTNAARVLLLVCIVASAAFGGPRPAAAGAPELDEEALSCEACLLVDDTSATLFARAAARRLPNASTTKMATALLALESVSVGDTVTVSRAAAATPGGGLALEEGDRARVLDLLYALMLSSSNDAAVALAEHVAGDEGRFVDRLNLFVRELGARRSSFVTAHGLDEPGHVSTARDLALLGAAVLEHPVLAKVVAARRAVLDVSGRRVEVENRNPLLESYRGAVGIKTGFTSGAGNVLVAAARRDGRLLIAVVMRSDDAAADAELLLDHGFALLERTVLLDDSRPVAALVFPYGTTGVIPLQRVRGSHRVDEIAAVFDHDARAPVLPGEIVGEVVVTGRRAEAGRVPAVAMDSVEDGEMPWPVALLAAILRVAALATGRAV